MDQNENAEPRYGPKMLALPNFKWQRFVEAFVAGGQAPGKGYTDAARKAGFKSSKNLPTYAARLAHDQRIQAAIQEEARRRTVAMLPLALQVHEKIMEDADSKDRLHAAKSVMDRSGLHAVTEERRSLEVTFTVEQRQRAVALAAKMGVPLEKLVGSRMALPLPVISPEPLDVEFENAEPV